jgi:hypothetical protein
MRRDCHETALPWAAGLRAIAIALTIKPHSGARMLEILFLRWFYKWLAKNAEAKNRTRSWGWLGVLGWLGCEITGMLLAEQSDTGGAYGIALCSGALGAAVVAITLSSLPAITKADFPSARVV